MWLEVLAEVLAEVRLKNIFNIMNTFLFLFSFITLQMFSLSPFVVEGPSMEPTLKDGDVFLINEKVESAELMHGDMVVFAFDDQPDYFYVKRIIALPGEKVSITSDGLYLHDDSGAEVKLREDYLPEGMKTTIKTEDYRDDFKHTYAVPAGKYFVMGDNRMRSLDSRYFKDPFVSVENIKGMYLLNLINLK